MLLIIRAMANGAPDWAISPRYQLLRLLGTGAYGSVCKGVDTVTQERVAVKQLRAIFEDQVVAKHLLREISILRRLNHPNIVQILNVLVPSDVAEFENVYVVMEYAKTDLHKMIKSPSFLTPMQAKCPLCTSRSSRV